MALSKKHEALLQNIAEQNKANGATWVSGETSMLHVHEKEGPIRFGCVDDPDDFPLHHREEHAHKAHAARKAKPASTKNAPAKFDWRDVHGKNYVTAVKDQGSCGSCVAFGTTAVIEVAMRIAANMPVGSPKDVLQDLSEAQVFYCGAEPHGRTCQSGWWASSALQYCLHTGVVPASAYPYRAGDQKPKLEKMPDWKSKVTKIQASTRLTDVDQMKEWLSTKGPLVTTFMVYHDFWVSYQGGVYKKGTSDKVGSHCVAVVGYDDQLEAWIVKNSWGTGWGMNGFFLMGYGQCGIDASMHGLNGFRTIYPFPPDSKACVLDLAENKVVRRG
jgi:C1A family cysteine protease